VIAVEPMVNAGRRKCGCGMSGWRKRRTAALGSLRAHGGGNRQRALDSDAAEGDERAVVVGDVVAGL